MATIKSVKDLTAQSIKTALHLPDGKPAVAYQLKSKDGTVSRRVTEQSEDFNALMNARTMAVNMRKAGLTDYVGILWEDGTFQTIKIPDGQAVTGGAVEI